MNLTATELYPIYLESDSGFASGIPEDLTERLREASAAFFAVQDEIISFMREEDRRKETERRLAERGQRRPKRRPNPTACAS